MEIDLTRLRHIDAISRKGSVSRAAEDLHITQPALSRSISSFEQRFGLRIFDRDRSGVVPTAMGRLVIAEAQRVLRSARDLEHNLRLCARGTGGDLAIGVGPLLAMLIPQFSQRLVAEAPGMHLRASVRTLDYLVQEILDDRIELIVGNSWSIRDLPDLEIIPIGSVRLAFMVRAGHPLLNRRDLRLESLSGHPQASAALSTSVAGLQEGIGTFTCDNYHVLRELVLQGDYVWLAAPIALAEDVDSGRLVPLAIEDFRNIDSEVALVHRRGRTLSPAAQALASHIRELITA